MQCSKCEKPAKIGKLCATHYSQEYRARLARGEDTSRPRQVCQCGLEAHARGLCKAHYQAWRRSTTGKGKRVSAGLCTDGRAHPWAEGRCRICGMDRPEGWV